MVCVLYSADLICETYNMLTDRRWCIYYAIDIGYYIIVIMLWLLGYKILAYSNTILNNIKILSAFL